MRNQKSKIKNQKYQRGFMLILAVLVSSIIIAIGLGISNFVLKELILSATARNSLYGFYSADGGVECAHYWDDLFGQRGGSSFDPEPPEHIYCDGEEITTVRSLDTSRCAGLAGVEVTYFDFRLGETDRDQYTEVYVCKGTNPAGVKRTRVQAEGYNSKRVEDPKRVERSHQSEYDG